jgi:hypothetical protein
VLPVDDVGGAEEGVHRSSASSVVDLQSYFMAGSPTYFLSSESCPT